MPSQRLIRSQAGRLSRKGRLRGGRALRPAICHQPCGDGVPHAQLCGRAVGNAQEGLSVFLRKYQLYSQIPIVCRKECTGEGEEVVFTEHLLYANTGSHMCGASRIQELRGPSLG